MTADSILLSLFSLVAGIIVTIIAGRYYAFRPTQKRLTPYICIASPAVGGIDDDVRKDLRIQYQEKEIEDLFQLQILVGNNGQRAILDYIEPPTLVIPPGVEVLDATILYAFPEGRSVPIMVARRRDEPTRIVFGFTLLNRGDFFLVKVLLDKAVELKNLRFEIVAEDLPATIELKAWTGDIYGEGIDWPTAVAGLVPLGLGLSVSYGLYLTQRARPDLFPIPWKAFEGSAASSVALLVTALLALSFLAIGLTFMVSGILRGFHGKPRFVIPPHLRQGDFRFIGIGTPPPIASRRRMMR